MRFRRAKLAAPAVILLVCIAFPISGSPSVSRIVQYHLAFEQFSDLYTAVRSGYYDAFPQQDLLRALLGTEGGLTRMQREILIEQLLIRAYPMDRAPGMSPVEDSVSVAISLVLHQFDQLRDSGLRARVLATSSELNIVGTEAAVLHSARHISEMLQRNKPGSIAQGYEIEAMALAVVAPRYPSSALAELLRGIAAHSRDQRVVSATRHAARLILLSFSNAIPGSI